MTATARVAVQPHTLVRREGARPGSIHAAVAVDGGWATACGELLTDGPRGTMRALTLEESLPLLEDVKAPLCARCARVGESTLQP